MWRGNGGCQNACAYERGDPNVVGGGVGPELGDPAGHPAPLALGGSAPDAISLTSLDCIVQAVLAHRASGTDGEADRRIVVGPGEEHCRVLSPALSASRPRPILIWIHERGHLILHTVCMTYRNGKGFPLSEPFGFAAHRQPPTASRESIEVPIDSPSGSQSTAEGPPPAADRSRCRVAPDIGDPCAAGGWRLAVCVECESACKPDSVRANPRRPSIWGRCCQRPRAVYLEINGREPCSCLTLLRVGFAEPPQSPAVLVVSYTTVSPLPAALTGCLGGLFSVALSVGLPRLGVTQHSSLWSPDFPRENPKAPPRSSGGLTAEEYLTTSGSEGRRSSATGHRPERLIARYCEPFPSRRSQASSARP